MSSLFMTDVVEIVRCVVCFEGWVQITSCGTLLCTQCFYKIHQCPNCRCDLNDCHLVRGIVAQLLREHFRSKLTKCDNILCDRQMAACEILNHKATVCQGSYISCVDCCQQIIRCESTEHRLAHCPRRIVNCEYCNTQIYFNETNKTTSRKNV